MVSCRAQSYARACNTGCSRNLFANRFLSSGPRDCVDVVLGRGRGASSHIGMYDDQKTPWRYIITPSLLFSHLPILGFDEIYALQEISTFEPLSSIISKSTVPPTALTNQRLPEKSLLNGERRILLVVS